MLMEVELQECLTLEWEISPNGKHEVEEDENIKRLLWKK